MINHIMNTGAKILLALGFVLSIFTNLFLFMIVTALYALYTYIVSILLRGIGWIASSKISRSNILTGLAVLILGIINVFGGLGNLTVFVVLWSVYTLLEALTYYRLRSLSKLFPIAMINILSVVIALNAVFSQEFGFGLSEAEDVLPQFQIVFVINMVSALVALIAVLVSKKMVESVEAT